MQELGCMEFGGCRMENREGGAQHVSENWEGERKKNQHIV